MFEYPQQIPPTPMPYVRPPDVSIVEMPEMSLWDSAPMAVGFWNEMQPYTVLFQAIIIIFMAGAVLIFIMKAVNARTTSRETME